MSWWQLGEGFGSRGQDLALYAIQCAFCNERGNWSRVFHAEKGKPNTDKRLNFDVYQCGNCAGYVHVLWSASQWGGDLHDFKVLPWPLGEPEPSKRWPDQVQRFWKQAVKSANSEVWDAASVMARSALQVALRQQGATGRTLKDEIDDLAMKGLLPPSMQEWATEVRLLGNEAAHPELETMPAEPQDIKDAIKFLDVLLYQIYDVPADIKEYRDRPVARTS